VSIRVEPWDDTHTGRVDAAFGPPEHWTVAQGRQGWRAPTDGEFWARCLVLSDGSEPIAVAAAFHPRLHTAREWAYVEVSPHRRRAGWGARALSEIRAVLPAHARPLRAKVSAGSLAAAMAGTRGMSPIQRTRQVRVSVPADLAGAQAHQVPARSEEAIRAWRDWYVAGHDWDPPSPQPDDFWAGTFGDAEHVLGVPGERGLAGIAHLYVEDGKRWFAGGALRRDSADANTIAAGLLQSARQLTGDPVYVELDDWMTDVTAVVDMLDHVVLDESFIVADR
jgi:hypothetical protein